MNILGSLEKLLDSSRGLRQLYSGSETLVRAFFSWGGEYALAAESEASCRSPIDNDPVTAEGGCRHDGGVSMEGVLGDWQVMPSDSYKENTRGGGTVTASHEPHSLSESTTWPCSDTRSRGPCATIWLGRKGDWLRLFLALRSRKTCTICTIVHVSPKGPLQTLRIV